MIIGASLTDEAPSNWEGQGTAKPDTDLPIRFVTVPENGGSVAWEFSVPAEAAAPYAHLIMRAWNRAALAECATGRDGCEKFGYILLWDQRRTDGALEVAIP